MNISGINFCVKCACHHVLSFVSFTHCTLPGEKISTVIQRGRLHKGPLHQDYDGPQAKGDATRVARSTNPLRYEVRAAVIILVLWAPQVQQRLFYVLRFSFQQFKPSSKF